MLTHLLEQISENGRGLHLAVDLPEVAFLTVFWECKFLVVGVLRVSASKWLEFHSEQKKCRCSRENVCFDTIIF